MIHAICDFCGKDCDRTATLLSMTPFQNFARYHSDNKPFGNEDKTRSFVICNECCKKHNLPNPYETYSGITKQEGKYEKCLDYGDVSLIKERKVMMENKKPMVNEKQLEKMKHAIGFRLNRTKGNRYIIYRNHFAAPITDNADWLPLIEMGYAEQGRVTETSAYFHVTRAGMDYIEEVTGIKIVDEEEKEEESTEYGLQLYKLCCTKDNEYEILMVDELGWIDDEEFCVWVPYLFLKEFINTLKEIFGHDLFDDGGFDANMQSDEVCIDLCQALNSFMEIKDIETVFPKDKYRH